MLWSRGRVSAASRPVWVAPPSDRGKPRASTPGSAPLRRASRALLIAACLGIAPEANAHLRTIGESLLAILDASDALVIAEATAATDDHRTPEGRLLFAHTPFALHATIAGMSPPDRFDAIASPPVLRYPASRAAIVALARPVQDGEAPGSSPGAWRALQGPGAALVLTEPLDPAVQRDLAFLWNATKPPAAPRATLAEPLARLLTREPRRLALLAAVDLVELAHAGELPAGIRRVLLERLRDPAPWPELRPLLEHALAPHGHRPAAPPPPSP